MTLTLYIQYWIITHSLNKENVFDRSPVIKINIISWKIHSINIHTYIIKHTIWSYQIISYLNSTWTNPIIQTTTNSRDVMYLHACHPTVANFVRYMDVRKHLSRDCVPIKWKWMIKTGPNGALNCRRVYVFFVNTECGHDGLKCNTVFLSISLRMPKTTLMVQKVSIMLDTTTFVIAVLIKYLYKANLWPFDLYEVTHLLAL